MNVRLYTYTKKVNSTAHPSTSGGDGFSCTLKDPSSLLNPVILLKTSNPTSKNYAYIEEFGRFYWIRDWVSDHNMWEAHLQVDPLGSWKTQILSQAQYVDRMANVPEDRGIIDGKYACTVNTQIENQNILGYGTAESGSPAHTGTPFLVNYRCMISATTQGADDGTRPQTISGTAYYYLTPGEAEYFIRYLLDDPTYLSLNVDEISDSLAKGIINPVEYIGESYILPYLLKDKDVPVSETASCKMYVGWWPVDVSNTYNCMRWATAFKRLKIWESDQIVLGNHPQASTVGKYVNTSPYTTIQLYAGPFGYITIDPLLLTKYTAMKLVVYGDFKGQVELDIMVGGYNQQSQQYEYVLWKKEFTDVKISLPLTQLSSDGVKAIGGAVAGLGQMATSYAKNDAFGMISGGLSGIMSLAGSQVPIKEGTTVQPSTTYMKDPWFIHSEYHLVTDIAPNLKGRPYCDDIILNTITNGGYVQISEPVLELAATPEEISQIEGYMQGGFFIE